MTAFRELVHTQPGRLLLLAVLLLLVAQLSVCLQAVRQRRDKAYIPMQILHALCLFVLLVLLRTGTKFSWPSVGAPAPVRAIYALPWLVFVAVLLLSALLLCLSFRSNRRWARQRLTTDAIKETLDLLPVAVCFGNEQGETVMANLRMRELCRVLTGRPLSDTRALWARVTAESEEQDGPYLVRMADGAALLFARNAVRLNGTDYTQLTAADMTDEYRITEELTAKNKRLRDVQIRMRSVSAREAALLIPREVMEMRASVHDAMGNLLLTVKNYLDHPGMLDEADILQLMQFHSRFLLGETEEAELPGDPITDALELSRRIGVTVEIRGALPDAGASRALIAQAIEQCAANTVRHAAGDRLTVTITEDGGHIRAVFTNNGKRPEAPIVETGGLAALRHSVESAGGAMRVTNRPAFSLTLCLPQQI